MLALFTATAARPADRQEQPGDALQVLAYELVRRHLVDAVIPRTVILAEGLDDRRDARHAGKCLLQRVWRMLEADKRWLAVVAASQRRIDAHAPLLAADVTRLTRRKQAGSLFTRFIFFADDVQ